mmetsp:Transcript_2582/g.5747  ORF Transcript_2582/g.5747 Transcript_2582/m.5747 type:complete len:132 (+) Transcript_2582:1077-1472(+)
MSGIWKAHDDGLNRRKWSAVSKCTHVSSLPLLPRLLLLLTLLSRGEILLIECWIGSFWRTSDVVGVESVADVLYAFHSDSTTIAGTFVSTPPDVITIFAFCRKTPLLLLLFSIASKRCTGHAAVSNSRGAS